MNSIEISDSTGRVKPVTSSFRVNTVLIAYFCAAKDHERRSIIRSVMADRYHLDDPKSFLSLVCQTINSASSG